MKKNYCIILCVIFTVLLSGCSQSKIQINTNQISDNYILNEDYQNYLESYSNMAKTDSGYYFINNNLLYFFDKESLETIVVCNKLNCEHNNDSCTAYFSAFNFYPMQLAYYNNALYVTGWETEGANVHHNYIYQISLDNYKRKKAAFLYDSNGMDSMAFILHRGCVYFTYGNDSMKESETTLYKTELGNTKNNAVEKIFEFTAIGSDIFGLSAYGNHVFFTTASYDDENGNGYNTSLNSIDIHTLEIQTIIENNLYSYFVNEEFVYYERDKNTVYKINLDTNEESFFCNIDGPCYISADENYLYFDNQQAMYIDESITGRKITVINKQTGNFFTSVVPKSMDDECLFGGNDFMFFKEITDEDLQNYYAIDKTMFIQNKTDYIDMD